MVLLRWITAVFVFMLACTCKQDCPVPEYKSRKLVLIMIDGARWQETWGDPSHQLQPLLRDSLAKEGVIFTSFYNGGVTFTVPGHTALFTGHYQDIQNNGLELPDYPSLLQLYLERYKSRQKSAAIITSKDKLAIFGNCENQEYANKYAPYTDCGISGNGSGYRHDSITFLHVKNYLRDEHPDVLLIQFREPDFSAHAGNYQGYLDGITQGDKYSWEIWKLLQADEYYRSNTTFVISNDHGRHSDGILDGYVSHGDGCEGCRHINLFMAGPDLKKNVIISERFEQIDVHKTLCRILNVNDKFSEGNVISPVFIK